MIICGDWIKNHKQLISGFFRLSRFLHANISVSNDSYSEIYVMEKDGYLIASIDIEFGYDTRLATVKLFGYKGCIKNDK